MTVNSLSFSGAIAGVSEAQAWKAPQPKSTTPSACVSSPQELFVPRPQLTSALNGLFAAKEIAVLEIAEDCKARRAVIKAQVLQEARERGFSSICLNYACIKDNAVSVKELFLQSVYPATSNPKEVTFVEDESALNDPTVVNFLKRRGVTRVIAMHSAEKQDAVGSRESFFTRKKVFQPPQMTSEERAGLLAAHFSTLNVSDAVRPQWMKLYLFLLESQQDRSFDELLELVEADMTQGLDKNSVVETCSYLARSHGRGELTKMDFLYVADAKQVPLLFRVKKVASSIFYALGLVLAVSVGKMVGVSTLSSKILSLILSSEACAIKCAAFIKKFL